MPRQQVPLKIVGGNNFGRYEKISVEQTFNMIISQGALVDYAGYARRKLISSAGTGRGAYASVRANNIFSVIGADLYRLDEGLNVFYVGPLVTSTGKVYFSENNNAQISISDSVQLYVYNYLTDLFTVPAVGFSPGFLSFQNGRTVTTNTSTYPFTEWRLSQFNDALTWPTINIGSLQSKPDRAQAALPIPGKGNMLFLMGKNVTEQWTDIGAALFPYQRSSSFSIDFGCINPATIAILEEVICWVGINESSGPVIFYSSGGELKQISTEGISFKLSQLNYPETCSGFLFKQDGHLIYQITWPLDNLSYIYDFSTQQFFTVTDPDLDYHIAQSVVYFNNKYYFVSYKDGYLYEFGTQYSMLDGLEMPRIRITEPMRLPNQQYFIVNNAAFTVENGQPNPAENVPEYTSGVELLAEDGDMITTEDGADLLASGHELVETITLYNMAIDLSVSKDGGVNFGSSLRYNMNPTGTRRSRAIWWNLGIANDITYKIQFNGNARYVAFDGVVETL